MLYLSAASFSQSPAQEAKKDRKHDNVRDHRRRSVITEQCYRDTQEDCQTNDMTCVNAQSIPQNHVMDSQTGVDLEGSKIPPTSDLGLQRLNSSLDLSASEQPSGPQFDFQDTQFDMTGKAPEVGEGWPFELTTFAHESAGILSEREALQGLGPVHTELRLQLGDHRSGMELSTHSFFEDNGLESGFPGYPLEGTLPWVGNAPQIDPFLMSPLILHHQYHISEPIHPVDYLNSGFTFAPSFEPDHDLQADNEWDQDLNMRTEIHPTFLSMDLPEVEIRDPLLMNASAEYMANRGYGTWLGYPDAGGWTG